MLSARPAKRRQQSEAPPTPRRKFAKQKAPDPLEEWAYSIKRIQQNLKKQMAELPASDSKGKARASSPEPFVQTTLPIQYVSGWLLRDLASLS
jgi:ferric-dicitrate binding protein FerR (iron transport regulator)